MCFTHWLFSLQMYSINSSPGRRPRRERDRERPGVGTRIVEVVSITSVPRFVRV